MSVTSTFTHVLRRLTSQRSSRILGGPTYSLTLHGDLPVYGTDHRSKMERAKFVLVVGQHLKDQVVREVGIESDRVVSTFLGIDTEKFRNSDRRTYLPGRLHLVSVGRLNRAKGYRHGLAAVCAVLERGIDISYTIVGDGPDRTGIESEIARLGLSGVARLAGVQSEDQVVELLQNADAFLLSSVGAGEAYPSVVIEAMASALPVVCSRIGATPEMITDGVNGLLIPQGAEAVLAEVLVMLADALMSDDVSARQLGFVLNRPTTAAAQSAASWRRLPRFPEAQPLVHGLCGSSTQ